MINFAKLEEINEAALKHLDFYIERRIKEYYDLKQELYEESYGDCHTFCNNTSAGTSR